MDGSKNKKNNFKKDNQPDMRTIYTFWSWQLIHKWYNKDGICSWW
jgi:hypothetical protein